MVHYDAYMLCTSPRSGSTLLCRLLAATGVAGTPESYFHRPSVTAWAKALGVSFRNGQTERERLQALVDAAVAKGNAGGLFGLRLQSHSLPFFLEQLRLLHPDTALDVDRIRAAFGRTLIVRLVRMDRVAQAVSYVKAEQTGLWHAAPDGSELERIAPPAVATYDADAIGKQVKLIAAHQAEWTNWFSRNGVDPYEIVYEELAENPLATPRALLSVLGKDPKAANGVVPETAKLADVESIAWVQQFREDHPQVA